jgi:hypothetical protein
VGSSAAGTTAGSGRAYPDVMFGNTSYNEDIDSISVILGPYGIFIFFICVVGYSVMWRRLIIGGNIYLSSYM